MSTEVTSTEFQAHAGRYIETAMKEPVYISKHGRPASVVLVEAEEYKRLKARDERYRTHAVHVSELDEEFVEGMLAQPIPEEAERFNDEYPSPKP